MKSKTIDRIAIISALCCALHCTLLPVLLGLTTWAGLAILKNPLLEYGFIISGILLAYFSLGKSLKEHRNHSPIRIAIIGVLILFISRLEQLHEIEEVFTVFGALFLVVAHLKNIQITYRYRKEGKSISLY